MHLEDAIKLLDAIVRLLGVMAWPITFAYIVTRFGSNIGDFLSNLGEMSVKGAGFEATAKRRQTDATAALAAANFSKNQGGATPESTANSTKEAVQAVGHVTTRTLRKIEGSRVLWVDDRPDNNEYERQALEAVGIHVVISESTDDALAKIKRQHFDLIISDMGRPPDPKAGYTLLDSLRSSGNEIPFIIYASSRSLEHRAEAQRKGAVGCTNRGTELFQMVVSTLS